MRALCESCVGQNSKIESAVARWTLNCFEWGEIQTIVQFYRASANVESSLVAIINQGGPQFHLQAKTELGQIDSTTWTFRTQGIEQMLHNSSRAGNP